jgi:hypothetical protein
MFMIFYCTKHHLSECNRSQVISIKQNVDFNFQPPAMFVFLFFTEMVLSCSSFKTYHHTKFHGPTMTGESLMHPPQKFECLQFWKG